MSFIAAAIIGGGALSAGASVFGASEQAGAEQAAAGTIASSTQSAISQILGLTGQGQQAISGYTGQGAQSLESMLAPYLSAGGSAASSLTSLLTGGAGGGINQQTLQNLPGYQFQLQQGEGAVNNAATTLGLGGNVIQAQTNLASGLASSNYGQYANLLQGLTNTGSSAATTGGVSLASLFGGAGQSIASLLGGAGQSIGGLTSTAGQNIAQTQVGAANAIAGGATGAASGISNSITQGLLLSKLLGGSGGALSDIRFKEDITPVGELDNELPVYSFRYKGDPTRTFHLGLMAHEVEKVKPKAVKDLLGIKFVDYEEATK